MPNEIRSIGWIVVVQLAALIALYWFCPTLRPELIPWGR